MNSLSKTSSDGDHESTLLRSTIPHLDKEGQLILPCSLRRQLCADATADLAMTKRGLVQAQHRSPASTQGFGRCTWWSALRCSRNLSLCARCEEPVHKEANSGIGSDIRFGRVMLQGPRPLICECFSSAWALICCHTCFVLWHMLANRLIGSEVCHIPEEELVNSLRQHLITALKIAVPALIFRRHCIVLKRIGHEVASGMLEAKAASAVVEISHAVHDRFKFQIEGVFPALSFHYLHGEPLCLAFITFPTSFSACQKCHQTQAGTFDLGLSLHYSKHVHLGHTGESSLFISTSMIYYVTNLADATQSAKASEIFHPRAEWQSCHQ